MTFDNIEPIALSTAPGRIAEVIRASILDGSFAPGAQLTEMQLAERLNVSRGPVREAMQRLVQEGLLWTKPHHGTFVVELGVGDVADIYLARRAIEGTAAIRLMGRKDAASALKRLDAAVAELRRAISSDSWESIVAADLKFHEELVTAAGSERLDRMFRTLTAESQLCMAAFVEVQPAWLKGLVQEYKGLVAAMRRGDRAETMERIDRHFELDTSLVYFGDVASHVRQPSAQDAAKG